MNKNSLIKIPLLVCLFCFVSSYASSDEVFEIKVDKPVFVIPQFSGTYSDREATISLEEYETAERLRALLDSGNKKDVLAELDKFYDLELSPAMLMLKAQVYFSLAMYDQAETTYLAVLKRMPQLVRAYSDLGQLYLLKNDYQKARDYFAKAVAFGSNEAIIHGQLAYLNLTLYSATSAISEYQTALALEPQNVQWQRGLLAALTQAKMYEASQAFLRELIQKNPNDPQAWLNQAILAIQQDDKKLALASMEMAILLGDDDVKNLKSAAQLHLRLNSFDRATELIERALSKGGLDFTSIIDYANWLIQANRLEQARKLLNAASANIASVSIDNQSTFYLQLALLDEKNKSYPAAVVNFKKSLDRNPTSGSALLAYAEFLSSRKDYVQAEFYYLRAEVVPAVEKKAMLGRAQMFIDSQNYSSAISVLRDVYKKYPEMSDLLDTITTLENIIRNRESA